MPIDQAALGRAMHHASDVSQHAAAARFCHPSSRELIGGWADEAFRKLADAMGYDVTPRPAPAIAAE